MHGVVAHSPGWLACKSSHWVMASLRSASHGFGVHANAIWSPFAHEQRTVVLDGSQGGRLVVVVVELVVVVVVDVVSQTWAAVHISASGQGPQFSGARVRQVPLAILPHWAPAASHVVGVQQAPAGLLPGGELLTHSPLWPFVPQQL